jgi:nucleotide sugar dehydrogenase
MIGPGYVGLVSGACFSVLGNSVVCVDVDKIKINQLKPGVIPFFEPGLEEIVKKNIKNKRLSFSFDFDKSIKDSDIFFICVGTPKKNNGIADLTRVYHVAKKLGKLINKYKILVTNSTVPVTTGDKIPTILSKKNKDNKYSIVSIPEFLREGEAIRDFIYPDRIVIGSNDVKANRIMNNLYAPLISKGAQYFLPSKRAAELIKYSSTPQKATKITFINKNC